MLPAQRRSVLYGTASPKAAEIQLDVPMPPSANKLYQRRRGGGLALTADALEYRRRVSQVVVDNLQLLQNFPVSIETIYSIDITLYLTDLENVGWHRFNKKGEREAKTRYKRVDVDNRVKFLQDCVSKSMGLPDDAQIFEGRQRKVAGKTEHVVVRLKVREPSEFLEDREDPYG